MTADPVLAARDQGRLEQASNDGGFLLLEADDVAQLLAFSARFKDLNDDLDITPVVELSASIAIVQDASAWVDEPGPPS